MTSSTLRYARGKFRDAVGGMASSPRTLRERLHSAMVTVIPVQERDFPEGDLLQRYRALRQELSTVPDEQAGAIQATLKNMADEDVERLARAFVDLADLLDHEV